MAKITRHGGPSDAYDPNRPDRLLGPHDGGNPAPEGAVNVGRPDTGDDRPQDDTGDVGPASGVTDHAPDPGNPAEGQLSPELQAADPPEGDDTTEAHVNLPAANALKSVWEEAATGMGLSADWVYADGRTKEQLVSACRGVADGTTTVSAEGEPVPSGDQG